MAKKQSSRYVCTNCGAVASAWSGRCQVCGEWNTLQEELILKDEVSGPAGGHPLKFESLQSVSKHDSKRLAIATKKSSPIPCQSHC